MRISDWSSDVCSSDLFKEESVLNDTGLSELDRRIEKALAMGGPEKLGRRRASGLLNARERIDYFVDKGSYIETGMFGVSSVVPEARASTPADGKVAGFAKVDQRPIGIVSNAFTVKGASSSQTGRASCRESVCQYG